MIILCIITVTCHYDEIRSVFAIFVNFCNNYPKNIKVFPKCADIYNVSKIKYKEIKNVTLRFWKFQQGQGF